jgi:hypothetical protein
MEATGGAVMGHSLPRSVAGILVNTAQTPNAPVPIDRHHGSRHRRR